ncbi:MAG: Sporulation protein YqfD [Desulfofundulus kuznetsovii]|nr:MAG: Sporulation protein YqfD [Desulfofundulus kuznetsovii]
MFLQKMNNYLAGYVTITVSGAVERFINLATKQGISIWDAQTGKENEVVLNVRVKAVKKLRRIARKSGCRFKIKRREGLPFLLSYLNKRKAMVLGCIFFLTALYIFNSFVWFVQVTGNRNIKAEDILRTAAKAGLERGVLRRDVNIRTVEKSIQDQLPLLSWVGIEIKGTRAVIEVDEKIQAQEPYNGPAHVVAQKSGLVEDILVFQGDPVVKEGDAVVEGQVLISGIILPPEDPDEKSPSDQAVQKPLPKPNYVNAKGSVRARCWYESYGEAPLIEKGRKYTGQVITRVCMKIRSREIILTGPRSIPFTSYKTGGSLVKRAPHWRNYSIPVEFITVKYYEIKGYSLHRTRKQARDLAGAQALARVRKELPAGAIILNKRLEEVIVNQPEDIVRIRVFVETEEEIGLTRRFTP